MLPLRLVFFLDDLDDRVGFGVGSGVSSGVGSGVGSGWGAGVAGVVGAGTGGSVAKHIPKNQATSNPGGMRTVSMA